MGSSGSGSFSDYSGNKPTDEGANNGGASNIDKCTLAFATSLEDVTRCFYFTNYGAVPPVGTQIRVIFNGIRLAAETMLGEEIGYLPTKLNYLKYCIDDGFRYEGVVRSIHPTPIPNVLIDCGPIT
jgi:hypothetical protein